MEKHNAKIAADVEAVGQLLLDLLDPDVITPVPRRGGGCAAGFPSSVMPVHVMFDL